MHRHENTAQELTLESYRKRDPIKTDLSYLSRARKLAAGQMSNALTSLSSPTHTG
jgi:hypothetical protein